MTGNELKVIRQGSGLSVREFGRRLAYGGSDDNIGRLERGERDITDDVAAKARELTSVRRID